MFGAAARDCSVNVAKPSSFALSDGNAQAFKSPQSLHPLTIYAPAFSLQECRDTSVAEARMPVTKFMQPLRLVVHGNRTGVLCTSGLICVARPRDMHDVPRPQTFLASGGRFGGAWSGLITFGAS